MNWVNVIFWIAFALLVLLMFYILYRLDQRYYKKYLELERQRRG